MTVLARSTRAIDREALATYLSDVQDAADRWWTLIDALGLPADATPADVLDQPTTDDSVTGTYLDSIPTLPDSLRDAFHTEGDA